MFKKFLGKAYAYQLYFNYKRKNRWKDLKTPIEILSESLECKDISSQVFNMPPVILDDLLHGMRGGHLVGLSVKAYQELT